MLHGWINREHVAAWWDAPVTLAEVEADYGATIDDDTMVQAYIAHADAQPIGFIQSYVAAGAGEGWWPDETDPGVRGIDQFLADGNTLNQGLGTAMVRAFMATLFADPAVTRIQTDPRPTNVRAIRCYEKAGFRQVGTVNTPDGEALLMVCDRADWRASTVPVGAHRWYTGPVFFVTDVQRAARFYIDTLGFDKQWHEGDGAGTICQVNRGECEIILCQDATRTDRGRLFIELTAEGFADLRREFVERAVPWTDTWWGYDTLQVDDPDGNQLFFPAPT
jgi:RimJ/RimL family protein N-acetyltransferase/catechol 2,3-dioxygenase-like lactoylglutathione lyase family enzyme